MKKSSLAAGLLATISAVAFGGGLAGEGARATTLMDLLRGGSSSSSASGGQQVIDAGRVRMGRTSAEVEGALSDPDPLPKVAAPRYFTYKADTARLIQTAKFKLAQMPAELAGAAAPESVDPRRRMAEVQVYATDEIAKVIEDYYGSGNPLLWIADNAVSERARAVTAALAAAGDAGLDPADYAVAEPQIAATATAEERDRALMRYELVLSAKVLSYVQDTERGRLDPNRISGYHDFKRKAVNLKPVLDMVRLSPDVGAYLRNRDPQSREFVALQAALKEARANVAAAEAPILIPDSTKLKPGQSSAELPKIVAAIERRGSAALKAEHAATFSTYLQGEAYSPELVALVEGFQKEVGLKPDGVIGQATIRKLVGDTATSKVDKLIVAMEQRRWLPDELGSRYVFINQPAFQVYYFNEDKQQLSMRVVVGSKSNQTFFFQDQIETVEFNPYWGVPQSIIVNEMLPKLRSDPGYLDKLGYEVSYGGRKVSSSEVNWGTNPSVDVRQPPGGDNALGELKILFPNAHAIYMHDTPSKSFFQRDMRALSHGCVRLQEPRVMAAAVLGTTVADVGKQIASGQNRAVSVPQKIPIYVSYFTAWPNKDGVVEYFADVYDRDSYTMKAFAATSAARAARS